MRALQFTTFCLAVAMLSVSATSQSRAPVKSANPPRSAPRPYLETVADLNTCNDLASRVATAPNALPLLNSLALSQSLDDSGSMQKDEFETSTAHAARSTNFWNQSLKDPTKIILKVKIPKYLVKFDADTSEILIKNLLEFHEDNMPFKDDDVEISSEVEIISSRTYTGQNFYGATSQVRAASFSKNTFVFPRSQFLKMIDDKSFKNYKFKSTVNVAQSFKENPYILVWIAVHPPYLTKIRVRDKPTIDDPSDFFTTLNYWHSNLKCMFAVSDNNVLATLHTDGSNPSSYVMSGLSNRYP